MSIRTIRKTVSSYEKGTLFLNSDLFGREKEKTIDKTLQRLAEKGEICKISRVIYVVPKEDKLFGTGLLLPSREEVGRYIAKRTGEILLPTHEYALNALGFSTQVQNEAAFLTTGRSRKVTLEGYGGSGITFIHTSDKRLFQIENRRLLLLTLALKKIGKEALTEDDMKKVKKHVSEINAGDLLREIKLTPEWIRKIILS